MPKINEKQKKAFSDINQLNEMHPMDALRTGIGLDPEAQIEAKKAVLQQLSNRNKPQFSPRTNEEDILLKQKGLSTLDKIKSDEANKQIQMLQQGIQDQETMGQFGDPDAAKQIEIKKELLRRYLQK